MSYEKVKKLDYRELEYFAMAIKRRGRHLCVVYSGSPKKAAEDILSNISNHLVTIVALDALDSTTKEACEYYSLENLRVVGYEITKLEVKYPIFYVHTRIAEKGLFHILKGGGEDGYILCGKEYNELCDIQDYYEGMEMIHKICRKCEKIYHEKDSCLF